VEKERSLEKTEGNIKLNTSRKNKLADISSIHRKVLLRNDESHFLNRNLNVIEANSLPTTMQSGKSY
jgi:hypothetical protein